VFILRSIASDISKVKYYLIINIIGIYLLFLEDINASIEKGEGRP